MRNTRGREQRPSRGRATDRERGQAVDPHDSRRDSEQTRHHRAQRGCQDEHPWCLSVRCDSAVRCAWCVPSALPCGACMPQRHHGSGGRVDRSGPLSQGRYGFDAHRCRSVWSTPPPLLGASLCAALHADVRLACVCRWGLVRREGTGPLRARAMVIVASRCAMRCFAVSCPTVPFPCDAVRSTPLMRDGGRGLPTGPQHATSDTPAAHSCLARHDATAKPLLVRAQFSAG